MREIKSAHVKKREPTLMDISWKWFCHVRIRNASSFILILLVTMTALTFILQFAYLHGSIIQTWTGFTIPSRSKLYSSFHRINFMGKTNALVAERNYRYEHFGKSTFIIRFDIDDVINQLFERQNTSYRLFTHQHNFSTFYNGNMSRHHTNPYAFFNVILKHIFLLSATGTNVTTSGTTHKHETEQRSQGILLSNSSRATKLKEVVLTGWVSKRKINNTLCCCILLKNETIMSVLNNKRLVWNQVGTHDVMATKLFCPVPADITHEDIQGITVAYPTANCNRRTFLQVEYPKKMWLGSLAICAKIAYGSMSAQRLIEWFEIQKTIGVDRVLIYFYNLNKKAMAVLRYYAEEGFIEARPFDYPRRDFHRYVGLKKAQPFVDEQVVVYDCMERLRGYTYVGIIDTDEIIYPKTGSSKSMKLFLHGLRNNYRNAAGFSFLTELFILDSDWQNKTISEPGIYEFWHERYPKRTRPLEDRVKNVFIMDRVIVGSIWTHNYTAKPGFIKYKVRASHATIKHYRQCRQNWNCYNRSGYSDGTITSMLHERKKDIFEKFEKLLFNYRNVSKWPVNYLDKENPIFKHN